jgi:hypothetical protein
MMMRERAALGSSTPSSIARVSGRSSWRSVNAAGVAAPLGRLLALDRVELLEHLDRDREIVVLELEDRLRIVQQDVRVQDEGLGLD